MRAGGRLARSLQSPLLITLIDTACLAGAMGFHGRRISVVYVFAVVIAAAGSGSYRRRIYPTLSAELGRLLAQVSIPLVALGALTSSPQRLYLLGRWPLVVVAVVGGRLVAYQIQRSARARSAPQDGTIIVGAGRIGGLVADTLRSHREYGLEPIGFVDGDVSQLDLSLPVLGDLRDLSNVIERFKVRYVIVAFGAHREADMIQVMRSCDAADSEMFVVPRLFELGVAPTRHDTVLLWGIPLQPVRRSGLSRRAAMTKRAIDVSVSAITLAVTAPLFLLAAIGVKLSSKGPVFFRQLRVGRLGGPISILKFRTMSVNRDSDTIWSVEDDQRVTSIGRLLRTAGIDELPQLINVLKGDMSLVGPRPERPHFVNQFDHIPNYRDRLRMPVGLTGWAQVHGLRGDTSITERAQFDNYYIEHWSPWLDIIIVFRTFLILIRATVKASATHHASGTVDSTAEEESVLAYPLEVPSVPENPSAPASLVD